MKINTHNIREIAPIILISVLLFVSCTQLPIEDSGESEARNESNVVVVEESTEVIPAALETETGNVTIVTTEIAEETITETPQEFITGLPYEAPDFGSLPETERAEIVKRDDEPMEVIHYHLKNWRCLLRNPCFIKKM